MNRLTNNWNLKLMALVLAIVLWGHVRGEVNPIDTVTYSLRLQTDLPKNLHVANKAEIPSDVRVTLRAPRSVFRQINGMLPSLPIAAPEAARQLPAKYGSARLDFTLARPGKQEIPVRCEISKTLDLLGVDPSNVALVLVKD
jgi:hypothetical protein